MFFPTLNAVLNGLSAILLANAWIAIKRGNVVLHRTLMLIALGSSTLFLTSYVYYHITSHLVTNYQGVGILRPIYFTILLTHTPLATLMVPFIFAAVYFAVKGNFVAHTRIARYLMPVWLYVSITGVVIYFMLYIF